MQVSTKLRASGAPKLAKQARIELYLLWAPRGRIEWSEISMRETDAFPRRKVRLATGRELSAIDIQTEYFDRVSRFLERRGADETSSRVVQEWGAALQALRSGQAESLAEKVDWVAKYLVIDRYRARHGTSLSHPKVALMDLAYHDVNRDRGVYYLLERRGLMERAVPEKQIQKAMREPPQTTRAKLRGEFIRHAKQRRRDYTVDCDEPH